MPQTQLPANFAGVLSMSAGQQMDLGVPTPSLNGSSAFTLSGWFQVPSASDTVVVLSQGSLFSFSFSQGKPSVALGSQRISLDVTLPAGQFHQLAAAYTLVGGNSGLLRFFVDGALAGELSTPVASPSSGSIPHLVVGNAQHPVAVRRLWLTPSVVEPEDLVNTRFGTTGAAPFPVQSTWDWGQIPAAIIGASAPVPIGYASPSVTTPGLQLNGSGVANATLPSETTFDQVTIQGWFWFPSSVSQQQVNQLETLLQVGTGSSPINLHVTPTASGTWNLGVMFGRSGFGRNSVQLSGWHNIAVTWAGGTTGTFYVDGALLNTGGQANLSGLNPSTVSIGNTQPGSQPSNQAFSGIIQNVVLWNTALSAEEVQAQMMPWFPMTDIDPLAVYDFTQSPPIDVVTGEPLSLQSGALVQDILWQTTNVAPSTQMLVAQPKKRQSLKGLRPQSPPKSDPTLWTPEKEEELLQSLQGYLAQGAADPRIQAEGPALVAKLKERFARGRAGNPDLTGIVHTELQGDEWITFHYGEDGPRAILRRSTTNFKADSCMNWVIDFVATALFGLLDIMGIPLSTGVATKALQKLLGKAKIWKAVGEVLESTINEHTIIALLKAIYDGGGLTAFVKAVLDGVSWWDFLWMVAQVILELIGLLVPGLEEALVLAKCVLLAAQLVQLMADRPAGCPA